MSAAFELHRFEAAPVSATVALVELDGQFDGPPPARVRLLVERGGRGVEVPAITTGGAGPWSATFPIALADLADDRTEFSLVPGRGPLIALPAPENGGTPDSDRYVQLARQANDLRHRLDEATAEASRVAELRADLAVAERRAEEEADRLRAEAAAAAARADEAEKAAAAARAERSEAVEAAASAREEQSSLRAKLRETEGRLTETERERAALRARAESADRTVAELTSRIEELEERVREAEARAVAAEDETRLTRRDLRDTRARLEAVLREQRHHIPERRGYEVPDAESPDADGAPESATATASVDANAAGDTDAADAAPGTASADASPDTDTEVAGDSDASPGPPSADGAPDTAPADADPDAAADTDSARARGDATEVLQTREIAGNDAPRTATATRATRVVRIWDDADDEPRPGEDREARHAPEELSPARIGARHIEPSETHPPVLTPARIMVGIALLLLIAALVAIVLGAGLV